ncbi:MAG: prepilin-type N-terminal cleavage/methylation domain-containing protein [Fimbriimonadaceae bacterium]|nr:prepilin-type N-terminal cleavage/methylation domain-containing protein [Fimbriimonadaceae bacterium]
MRKRAFTLVEIMIVVLIIGVLLAIAVPQFMRARAKSQARTCVANLRQIEAAKEMFAMENKLQNGAPVTINDIWPTYIRQSNKPECPNSGVYTIDVVGTVASCSYVDATFPHVYQ